MSPEGLPRGDSEVLAGPSVCVFHLNARDTEAWVVKVRERSGQRVDWGYSCGYAIVSYLGDREAVLKAMRELRHELVGAERFRIYSQRAAREGTFPVRICDRVETVSRKGGVIDEWPPHLRIREFPSHV